MRTSHEEARPGPNRPEPVDKQDKPDDNVPRVADSLDGIPEHERPSGTVHGRALYFHEDARKLAEELAEAKRNYGLLKTELSDAKAEVERLREAMRDLTGPKSILSPLAKGLVADKLKDFLK